MQMILVRADHPSDSIGDGGAYVVGLAQARKERGHVLSS